MTGASTTPALVVGISSRALFNLDEAHAIFEQQGVDAYCHYQTEHEDTPLEPGVAFALARKLLGLNARLGGRARVELILLSRNSADTGLRVFNSLEHHQLSITRAVFTGGASPFNYANALGAHLFLSANAADVTQALASGMAAATIVAPGDAVAMDSAFEQLRIAFDGDAVLFSDESERIFREQGLVEFEAHERAGARQPLPEGPFKRFLTVLHELQNLAEPDDLPIRTALITARGAPAHERVIRTLRDWGVRIDEALFLGGMEKGAFLRAFGADIFFDDQARHCQDASQHVPTGHVPHGVANQS